MECCGFLGDSEPYLRLFNTTNPRDVIRCANVPDDDPSTLLKKLKMLVDIIPTNASLAAATNYQATPIAERDAVKAAESQLGPAEHYSWKAYLRIY